MAKRVQIYTDGSCLGNPGTGGYAAILICGEHRQEISGGVRYTTSWRMELQAVIAGLEALKFPCQVTVYADADYVVRGGSIWLDRWAANGWQTSQGKPLRNVDLWKRLRGLIAEQDQVNFVWVAGHAGHPLNERADSLAQAANRGTSLPADAVYEELAGVKL